MDISVIIVNYNTAQYINDCINSVLKQKDISYEIIVVDNASSDDSLTILESYGNKIKLIKSPENLGFARANNLAFNSVSGEFLFLLNPDAFFTTENDLSRILNFIKTHPQYGIVGTQIIKGTQDCLPSNYYPGQKNFNIAELNNLPGKIAWILGASLIISTKFYETIYGFDNDFFLYGDDLDICLRVRKAGYEIGYFPEVIVKHIGGGSEKKNNQYQITVKKQHGLHVFLHKHYSLENSLKFVKRELRRAVIRLFLLSLKKHLLALDATEELKYAKYRAIYDTSKEFLTRIKE